MLPMVFFPRQAAQHKAITAQPKTSVRVFIPALGNAADLT